MGVSTQFSVYKSLGQFQGDFVFGKTDCCQLARHVVKDRLGIDFGARFDYADEKGAMALMEEYGGVEGVITEALGFEPSSNFHHSDLALTNVQGMIAVGIVVRNSVAVMAKHGLILINSSHIVSGWCLCRTR